VVFSDDGEELEEEDSSNSIGSSGSCVGR